MAFLAFIAGVFSWALLSFDLFAIIALMTWFVFLYAPFTHLPVYVIIARENS